MLLDGGRDSTRGCLDDREQARSRFLGLSEFGPQSIIYHEGSTYRVKKVMLGIHDEDSVTTSAQLPVHRARLCPTCGYAHFDSEKDYERCVNCQARLDGGRTLLSLYRIEQVSTRRATRITSDEEERQRQGYEMVTTLRYALANGQPQCTSVLYSDADTPLLEMRYGPAATLWRVNLGWRRRHPAVLDLLCRLTHCEGVRGAFGKTAEELFEALSNLSLSSLEQAWLAALRQHGYHLPDKAQPRLADYGTQADFGYASVPALIYIDGPHHDTAHRRQIDATINRRLEEAGYMVVRFPKERDAWPAIFASHAFVFGTCKP